jgi:hypothetical protein
MSGQPCPDRFMIRRSASGGVKVWDRERKGPAMFNGQPAIGLTDAQAVEKTTFQVGREFTKKALD